MQQQVPQVFPEKGSACQEGFVPVPCSSPALCQKLSFALLQLCDPAGARMAAVTVPHVDRPRHQGKPCSPLTLGTIPVRLHP